MSVEIPITLAGFLLTLLAIIGNIKTKNSTSSLLSAKLRVALGLIGILLIMYGGYSFGTFNFQGQMERIETGNVLEVQYPVENVQIISPIDGDVVDCRILTKGVYPESHEKDIWVRVKPSDEFYYPQSDHTNTSYKRNGEWQVITRFGGDQDESYDIVAYETDTAASLFFSNTIQSWKDALTYPGLDVSELPGGAVELDRITVTLRESCRGVF
jgi:hypothetical protein